MRGWAGVSSVVFIPRFPSACVPAHEQSVDPYLRGRIKSSGDYKAGDTMLGFVAGKVIASNNRKRPVGMLYGAHGAFTTVALYDSDSFLWELKVDEAKISYGIGVLGMPGATAYGGVVDVLRPEKDKDSRFVRVDHQKSRENEDGKGNANNPEYNGPHLLRIQNEIKHSQRYQNEQADYSHIA